MSIAGKLIIGYVISVIITYVMLHSILAVGRNLGDEKSAEMIRQKPELLIFSMLSFVTLPFILGGMFCELFKRNFKALVILSIVILSAVLLGNVINDYRADIRQIKNDLEEIRSNVHYIETMQTVTEEQFKTINKIERINKE